MNKLLRRPKPVSSSGTSPPSTAQNTAMSRTMQLALRDQHYAQGSSNAMRYSKTQDKDIAAGSVPPGMVPRSTAAQYWAFRAIAAETVLSQRIQHQNELMQVRLTEEKRMKEIATLVQAHEKRQRTLEGFMVALVVFLAYMLWRNSATATSHDPTGRRRMATHFTVPILSPFTSVVENETGVLGTRAIVAFVLAMVLALFVTLRRWTTLRTGV
ncbi:hypothetical protein ID866_7294 [Astraeus odoratus]|nr:hypothetical protein ID866_7294 [Astraeus odoratus]